jgi:hypothetical protein
LLENKKFKPEVFSRVLNEARVIGYQNGQQIRVGEFPLSLPCSKFKVPGSTFQLASDLEH